MISMTNLSEVAQFTKFMMPNKILNTNSVHTGFSTFPPFFYVFNDPERNTSFYHELLSNANNYTYHDYMPHTPCPTIQMPVGNLISMILYAVVCIMGLFGNTLVIYAVLRFTNMRTVTNMYILNLAIADECFLIGIPFLIITMHLGEWTFGKIMCKTYMVSTSITQFTSSIFLIIMSADRYIAICHPVSSTRYRSPFVAKMVALLAWTISAIFMLPVMMYATTIESDGKDKKTTCNIEWPQDDVAGPGTAFTLYSLILGFVIPLSLILTFYSMVLRKLQTVGPKTRFKDKKRSYRKVTKLVLIVITAYVLCWLPYWISQVALITSPPDICNTQFQITLFVLVGCMGYSNSAINPILYAFLSDNFKNSFLKAFSCEAGKDFNTQLQLQENSFFPRFGKRNSEKYGLTTKTGGQVGSIIVTTNASNNNLVASATADRTLPNTCTLNFEYRHGDKSPQYDKHNNISNLEADTISLYSNVIITERPPVLNTDL